MNLEALVKRARLMAINARADDLDTINSMLDGSYEPRNGEFTPPFKSGSSRHKAFLRAVKKVSTSVPLVINKSLAGLDFGGVTWSDAETQKDQVDEALGHIDYAALTRDLATQIKTAGACALMASTPLNPDGAAEDAILEVLTGVNIPYTDRKSPSRVSGWYRAIQYLDENNSHQLRWWVEAYEFLPNGLTIHRVWRSLSDPTHLALTPDDEFTSPARPRFALHGLQPDGLPTSPVLTNMGRILGLYATELSLSTVEELAAYPMLVLKGEVDLTKADFGPAEPIVTTPDGDAAWMEPGNLDQLRDQVRLRRDQLREAFNLHGGALGGQTPSGDALREWNRGFMQETRALADDLSGVLTRATQDYLALLRLPPVDVQVPVDRSYITESLLETVEKGVDLNAIPASVAARWFQQALGTAYSDEELTAFLEEQEERRSVGLSGFLAASDRARDGEGEDDGE